MWHCFAHFVLLMYAEITLPELPEEIHQPVVNFLRDLLARKNLYTAASRANGLAAKRCWLHCGEAQDVVFCYLCSVVYQRQ